MSQLREQTQDNESEEDTKEDLSEDSKEDLSEDSKENLDEDSKENLDEDSKENLDEDSKENLDEDSEEELEEDSDKDLDEDLDEELKEDSSEGLDEDQPIDLDLGDARLNIDQSLSDLDSLDPNTNEGKESINLDLSDVRLNIDPSLSDLGSLDPDTKEGISTEPIDLDLCDARLNIDPSLSDLDSLDPNTKEGISAEPIDFDLSDARVNIDPSLSDLGSLDPDTKEGISTEPIEIDHSDINPYIDDNEGTTTSLKIKRDEESNHMSELNVKLSDMDSELASELQGDSDVQDIARDELSKMDAELLEMDDISSSEFREVPVIQDVSKGVLSELDGEVSEMNDIISRGFQEAPVIQDMLENELSELDGELSEIKDISSSDFQDSKITQDIAREEIKDELMKLDNESWNIKDIFSNEFVDLSDTQYSIEEDFLETSNVIEPVALDITNVHNKTLGQDYIGEPQIESVYEEGNENEFNYDLSIDKNNDKTENEKVGEKSKKEDLFKVTSEQELSLIGKVNGVESKKISATTSSTTSKVQKDNQEDAREEEQTSEQEKENEREETSADSKEQDESEIEEEIDKDDYKNLMDSELQRYFKGYFEKTGKYANHGFHITNVFKNYLNDHEKIPDKVKNELLDKISKINENKEIENFVNNLTKFSNLSQSEIRKIFNEIGLRISQALLIKFEEIDKDNYRNLMDSELQRYFKEYFEKTGKKANWRLGITNGFKNFLENHEKISDKVKEKLLNKISKINENKEILIFLKSLIKSSNLSSPKIEKVIKEMGLVLTKKKVRSVGKKILRKGEYEKRFPAPPKIPKEVREKIISDIKNPNGGAQTDLSKKYGSPTTTISKIAKKILTPEEYKKRFPAPPKIPKEVREKIIADIKDPNSGSQTGIAEKHSVTQDSVSRIAKEILTPEEYDKRFFEPIPKEVREKIIADIKDTNSGSQRDIAKKYGVSTYRITTIAKETLTLEEYEKRFPSIPKIPKEIRAKIISDIKNPNAGSLEELADQHGVSIGGILYIAKKILTPDEYEKRFPQAEGNMVGIYSHKNIQRLVTEDFDKRRKNSSDVPKIYSEPRIYQPLSEKHADLLFNNDTKFLQRLLKDLKVRNLLTQELEKILKKLDRIKIVQFDLTNWLRERNVMDKILKYQHPEILLFIVGTKWYRFWDELTKELPNDKRIKYPENIIIISSEYFAELMKIKGIYKEKFDKIIELNRKGDLDGLKEILKNTDQILHNTDELIKDFKEKGYMKKDINEYVQNIDTDNQPEDTLDRFIYNEGNKREQKPENNDGDDN